MVIDDLKNKWENINIQITKQDKLTTKMIDQMTKNKYNLNIKKIAYPEFVGMLICLLSCIYIGFNFNKLNSLYLQSIGIISILILIILSAISIINIWQFNKIGDFNKTHSQILKEFTLEKIRFYQFQKVNFTLCCLLLVATTILLPKFFNGKDITESKYFWTFSFSFGFIFLLFFSKWVFKYYKSSLNQAEDLLKDLNS